MEQRIQILKSDSQFDKNLCPAVALGTFDGIHTGHKKVLKAASNSGLFPVALVINRKRDGSRQSPLLTTEQNRVRLMEGLGIKCLVSYDLAAICNLSPEQFVIRILKEKFNAKQIFCGFNFRFGKNAAGNTEDLSRLCSQNGMSLSVVEPACCDGIPVSSTRIRSAVEKGQMMEAAKMLSRYFCFDFPVEQGDKIGRTIGMPTINQIFPKDFILPKAGVYAVNVNIDGTNYKGVCNIGPRPTIDRFEFRAETNIIGFSGNLYGKRPTVSLVEYIRETKKFPSLAALRQEVERNIEYTEKLHYEGDLIG